MEKIAAVLKEHSSEGRISCQDALEIALRLNVSPAVVGKTCNELKIKIKGCQLGCFK